MKRRKRYLTAKNTNVANHENWVVEHGDYLFRYAYLRLNTRDFAEDLVQDTFLAAIQSFDNFKGESSIRTWLISILKRKIIDYYRNLYKTKNINLDELEFMTPAHYFNAGSWRSSFQPKVWDVSTEKSIENKELMQVIMACVNRLPEKWQACFILRMIEGYSSDEVCQLLDLSSANLWVILYRCRMKLRTCLERNWFNDIL